MDNIAKVLVGLAALGFLAAVSTAFMGGWIANIPAESFSRTCTNLSLLAIALMMMGKQGGGGGE